LGNKDVVNSSEEEDLGRWLACGTTVVCSSRSRHISIFITKRDKEPLKSVSVVALDCSRDIIVDGFLED
jgi:hypothetical protein